MHNAIKAATAAIIILSPALHAKEAIDLGWQPPDWSWEPTRETIGHFATRGFDPAERELRQLDLYFELKAKRPSLAAAQGFSITVPEQDLIDIGQVPGEARDEAQKERRYLVGVSQPVNRHINFNQAALNSANSRGVAHQNGLLKKQGGLVTWAAPARSDDATAMRVLFSNVNLAQGAELFVMNELGQAHGPYVGNGPWGSGEFWANTLAGPSLTIQLQGSEAALAASTFTIAELGHLGPRYRGANGLIPEPFRVTSADPSCTSATCVVDGSCADAQNDWAHIDNVRDSIARILFFDRGWYLCSGGLIADDDDSTEVPLFLTANHCISRARVAETVETEFNFQTPSCGDCGNAELTPGPSGATVLATNRTSDFTLLELSGSPPQGAYFAGTSTANVANSNGTALYRISHPEGKPQSYSEHTVDTGRGTCRSWPRGPWIYSVDQIGATQGGSSGSPVFNAAGQVVGQLSGGCGTNVYEDCDWQSNATVDGALAAYYDEVAPFLSPDPDSCTPEGDICDGIDNDCDGQIDEGLDCGSGNEGLDDGEPCKRDNQCASGQCLGKGRDRVCG